MPSTAERAPEPRPLNAALDMLLTDSALGNPAVRAAKAPGTVVGGVAKVAAVAASQEVSRFRSAVG